MSGHRANVSIAWDENIVDRPNGNDTWQWLACQVSHNHIVWPGISICGLTLSWGAS